MPYWMRATIIVCVAAVAAFFAAYIIIPERDGIAPQDTPAETVATPPPQTPREPIIKPDEEVPVVTVGPPQATPESAAPHITDAKTVTASEIKTVTMDTKNAAAPEKAVDTKRTATPEKAVDTKRTAAPEKIADTKKAAVPDAKKAAAPEPAAVPRRQDPSMPYKIDRAVICAAIENRGPANITNKFPRDARQAFYFTHVTGARDSTAIIHRWYHNGKLEQTSILPVRSPNWRTHSKRYLFRSHEPSGEWKVEAVEPKSGKIMETATFIVE